GLIDLQGDISLIGGVVNNQGTLRKSAGTGTSSITGTFNNQLAAVIELDTGTLTIPNGGSMTGGDTFQLAAGTVLDMSNDPFTGLTMDGTFTTSLGSSGGTVKLNNGAINDFGGPGLTFDFDSGVFQWTGGSINSFNFTNQDIITLSGPAAKSLGGGGGLGGTLNNKGMLLLTPGTSDFQIGGTVNNG